MNEAIYLAIYHSDFSKIWNTCKLNSNIFISKVYVLIKLLEVEHLA